MDANFIEIVDNIYETKFIDRMFLEGGNFTSKDKFLEAIAGSSMGNLFGGAIDMFDGESDTENNTKRAEDALLKEIEEEGPCTWIFSPKKVRLVFKKRDTEFEVKIKSPVIASGKTVSFVQDEKASDDFEEEKDY